MFRSEFNVLQGGVVFGAALFMAFDSCKLKVIVYS